jgi:hypothetical protein
MSELYEPFPAPEFFVNGFDEQEVRDGVFTCVAYRIIRGEKVIVCRLAIPAVCVSDELDKSRAALHQETSPPHALVIADRPKLVS